jgi:hypothetical protein
MTITYSFADATATKAVKLREEGSEFYLVSTEAMKPSLDLAPFGVELRWIDGLASPKDSWSVMEFLKLYNLIDGLAFDMRGLAMPHWVMVDLALLPSAIVIAAWTRSRLLDEIQLGHYTQAQRDRLNEILEDVDQLDYSGPIPVAAYCAAPAAQTGRWVGWSLWSFVVGHGLATTVKALGLGAYRATVLDGVTQYDNVSLRIHTKYGPMKLRSAALTIHTAANSLVYETDLSAVPMDVKPSFWLDAKDTGRQMAMQKSIEAGESDFYIVAPGLSYDEGKPIVPIVEVPRAH